MSTVSCKFQTLFALLLRRCGVVRVGDGFEPCVPVRVGMAFDGEVAEPRLRPRAVPVLDVRRNLDDRTRHHLHGLFAARRAGGDVDSQDFRACDNNDTCV